MTEAPDVATGPAAPDDSGGEGERPAPPAGVRFHGRVAELYAIFLGNLLGRVVTLGVYHFWAKTRVRRYLWSQMAFAGDRFEYTGTGGELLAGFAKALALLLPVGVAFALLAEAAPVVPALAPLVGPLGYLGITGFGGFARYSARRYRMGRTRWRSIRFRQEGSAVAYGAQVVAFTLIAAGTLGLGYPVMRHHLLGYPLNHARFGTLAFRYQGRAGALFRAFLPYWLAGGAVAVATVAAPLALLGWLGADPERFAGGAGPPPLLAALVPLSVLAGVAALAVLWLAYTAREYRYVAAHTSLGPLGFALRFGGLRLAGLWGSNLAALIASAGLAWPWVAVRTARFLARHLEIRGTLDEEAVRQAAAGAEPTGEGLLEALDVGDLGI